MTSTAQQTQGIIARLRHQGFWIEYPQPTATKFSKTLAKFHKMRANGRCVKCGKPTNMNEKTNTPKVYCEFHAEKNRLNSIERRKKLKAGFLAAEGATIVVQ